MGFLPQKLVNKLSRKEELPPLEKTSFRIGDIKAKQPLGLFLKIAGPLLDRIFGTHQLHIMFHRYKLWNYEGKEFLDHFIPATGVRYSFDGKGLLRIPKTGRTLMIANHPHGGIEGVILSHALASRRDDYKLFVNIMLYFIKELARFFIFTNPMLPGSISNARAIRKAQRWLKEDHCLIIFPAGRVGLYRSNRGYITDESWDRMALSLCINTDTPIYPVFIDGQCSSTFSWSCRLFFPMKLLMLVNEFLRSFKRKITFYTGLPIYPEEVKHKNRTDANSYLRMRTYLLAPLSPDGLGGNNKDKRNLTAQIGTDHTSQQHRQEPASKNILYEYFVPCKGGLETLFATSQNVVSRNFWNRDETVQSHDRKHNFTYMLLFFNNTASKPAYTLKSALVTAHWLYRYLQKRDIRKTKIRQGTMLYPKPIVQSHKTQPLRLHREVAWYFNRHTIQAHELEIILSSIEERAVSIPKQIDSLRGYTAAGMSWDSDGFPILLLVHTL